MPLFVCEACHTLENTALGWYWSRGMLGDPRALCCVCAPRTYNDGTRTEHNGRWHGEFPRRTATRFDGVVNPEHLPPLYDYPRKQAPPNAPNTRARKRQAKARALARDRKTGSAVVAALIAVVATCGPTAPAVAADPPPAAAPKPELVCRERRTPDVPAPVCTGSRGVVQPCSGVLVSPADLLACARAESDLVECRSLADIAARECAALRASDMKGCADREASVVAERDAARALAAAHAAELERLRSSVVEGPAWYASPWLWGAVGVVVGASAVALAR